MMPIVFGLRTEKRERGEDKIFNLILVGDNESKQTFLKEISKTVNDAPTIFNRNDTRYVIASLAYPPRFQGIYESQIKKADIILYFGKEMEDIQLHIKKNNNLTSQALYPTSKGSTIEQLFDQINSCMQNHQSTERYRRVTFHRSQILPLDGQSQGAKCEGPLLISLRHANAVNTDPQQITKDLIRTAYFLPRADDKKTWFDTVNLLTDTHYCQGDWDGLSDTGAIKNALNLDRLGRFPDFLRGEEERISYITKSGLIGGVSLIYDPITQKIACCSTVLYPKDSTDYNDAIVTVIIPESIEVNDEEGNLTPLYKISLEAEHSSISYSEEETLLFLSNSIDNDLLANHVKAVVQNPEPFIKQSLGELYTQDEIESFTQPPNSLPKP